MDLLFAFAGGRPLTRALLMEYRTSMEALAPSTVNVRWRPSARWSPRRSATACSPPRRLRPDRRPERPAARHPAGQLADEGAGKGTAGCPDRSTLKGKRDYAILALLVGCALRRRELASLTVEDIQMRENRWVIADLRGKGGRIRTVAVPVWVKNGINAWQTVGRDRGRTSLVPSDPQGAARSGRA